VAGRMSGEAQRQEVAALYVIAREGVIRYLIASGIDPHAAADVTQDAFLRFYTALRDGEEIEQPRAWVYKVARNLAINTAKRDAKYSALTAALEAGFVSPESTTEVQMIDREWREGFRDAIEHLSERQRLCLELRTQGLRYREIAQVLEIQVSTAAEYVRRGIEELKKWNRCRS
jgi:RNA polymerase sigma-70 factor (ECF subfamily)